MLLKGRYWYATRSNSISPPHSQPSPSGASTVSSTSSGTGRCAFLPYPLPGLRPGRPGFPEDPPPTHRARTEPPDASPPDATPRPSPQARSHEPSTADSHPPAARTPRTRPRPAKPPQNPDPQPCELNTPSFT